MFKVCYPVLLIFGLLAPVLSSQAGEDADLSLIPQAVKKDRREAGTDSADVLFSGEQGRVFVEDDFMVMSRAEELPVPVSGDQPDWQNRIGLDARWAWNARENLVLSLSDRFSMLENSDSDLPERGSVRNDLREIYVELEASPGTYWAVGRINVKNGVALGYNPTDFFKPRSLVSQASSDPSALRESRLGTLMVKAQHIWDAGSVGLYYAPEIQNVTAISATAPATFDALFGQTNSSHRLLLTLNYDVADLSPQFLLCFNEGEMRAGLNLSRVMARSLVGYLEWSGGRQAQLSARAAAFGKETGTLPDGAQPLPQNDTRRFFQNDAVLGISWTGDTRLTVNLEYHYHEAGFSRQDWNDWISLGKSDALLASQMWYVRQYAGDQQEPLMQNQVFMRAYWPDAYMKNLELGAFVMGSPDDGSGMLQASASYFFSKVWTVGGFLSANFGGNATVYGSLPQSSSAVLRVVRYL